MHADGGLRGEVTDLMISDGVMHPSNSSWQQVVLAILLQAGVESDFGQVSIQHGHPATSLRMVVHGSDDTFEPAQDQQSAALVFIDQIASVLRLGTGEPGHLEESILLPVTRLVVILSQQFFAHLTLLQQTVGTAEHLRQSVNNLVDGQGSGQLLEDLGRG